MSEKREGMTIDQAMELLRRPFPAGAINWRLQRSGVNNGKAWGLAIAYLDSRAIMDRLDDVVGNCNWSDSYRELNNGTGFICTLTLHLGGTSISKEDGAQVTDIESIKGGISDALKRAAVKWGIGRYLYDLEETYVETSLTKQPGWNYANDKKTSTQFWWKVPSLPGWALPELTPPPPPAALVTTSEPVAAPSPVSTKNMVEQLKAKILARTSNGSDSVLVAKIKTDLGFSLFKEFESMSVEKLAELNKKLDGMK